MVLAQIMNMVEKKAVRRRCEGQSKPNLHLDDVWYSMKKKKIGFSRKAEQKFITL